MNPNQIIQFIIQSLKTKTASIDSLQLLIKNHGITKIQMLAAGVSNEDVTILFQVDAEELLKKIRNNELDNRQIKTLIETNEVTENLLITRQIKTKDELDIIMERPVDFYDTQFDFSDVPDLQQHRTDVFVFGVAGSGKSSFMAGLMYYTHKFRGLDGQIENTPGYVYMKSLINTVKSNQLPKPTAKSYVQYMECDFKDINGKYHPLTFIEMSGELFENCYGKRKDQLDPKFNRFLFDSPNNKIIFLAIDYNSHLNGNFQLSQQDDQFEFILKFLALHKMMDSVESICILITKWDMSKDKNEAAAKAFLESEYLNLFQVCKRFEEEYGLNFRAFPFSLGDFNGSNRYEYNPLFSEQIYNFLCNATRIREQVSRVGFFRRLFN